jgi:hypothetical protein
MAVAKGDQSYYKQSLQLKLDEYFVVAIASLMDYFYLLIA